MWNKTLLTLLVFAILSLGFRAGESVEAPVYDVAIIGCGPGGIQTALYAQQEGLSYVVVEGRDSCGSIFTHYPRQRKLESAQNVFGVKSKRYKGYDKDQIRLRHSPNDLIGTQEGTKPFRSYTSINFMSTMRRNITYYQVCRGVSSGVLLNHGEETKEKEKQVEDL